MNLLVVGPGRVGSALARALAAAGEAVLALHGRPPYPPTLAEAACVVVAVPDAALGAAGDALAGSGLLRQDAVVLHTAGNRGPDALGAALARAAHPGTLHPLQTFPLRGAGPPLDGVPFAVAGDPQALGVARALARALGGVPIEVPDSARSLYHAAAVLACGHLAALSGAAAAALGRAAGMPPEEALSLLGPIQRETLRNLERLGLPAAITGPAARGDEETVRQHLESLRLADPRLADLYAAIDRATRALQER